MGGGGESKENKEGCFEGVRERGMRKVAAAAGFGVVGGGAAPIVPRAAVAVPPPSSWASGACLVSREPNERREANLCIDSLPLPSSARREYHA